MLLPHCRTQLVGHSSESANQIKQCIDDWVTAGLAKGRAFAIAGSNLTVSFITKYYCLVYIHCSDNEYNVATGIIFQIFNFTATTAAPSGDAALPTWAWIIIAVGGAILVACLVAVLFSIAICVKRGRR